MFLKVFYLFGYIGFAVWVQSNVLYDHTVNTKPYVTCDSFSGLLNS